MLGKKADYFISQIKSLQSTPDNAVKLGLAEKRDKMQARIAALFMNQLRENGNIVSCAALETSVKGNSRLFALKSFYRFLQNRKIAVIRYKYVLKDGILDRDEESVVIADPSSMTYHVESIMEIIKFSHLMEGHNRYVPVSGATLKKLQYYVEHYGMLIERRFYEDLTNSIVPNELLQPINLDYTTLGKIADDIDKIYCHRFKHLDFLFLPSKLLETVKYAFGSIKKLINSEEYLQNKGLPITYKDLEFNRQAINNDNPYTTKRFCEKLMWLTEQEHFYDLYVKAEITSHYMQYLISIDDKRLYWEKIETEIVTFCANWLQEQTEIKDRAALLDHIRELTDSKYAYAREELLERASLILKAFEEKAVGKVVGDVFPSNAKILELGEGFAHVENIYQLFLNDLLVVRGEIISLLIKKVQEFLNDKSSADVQFMSHISLERLIEPYFMSKNNLVLNMLKKENYDFFERVCQLHYAKTIKDIKQLNEICVYEKNAFFRNLNGQIAPYPLHMILNINLVKLTENIFNGMPYLSRKKLAVKKKYQNIVNFIQDMEREYGPSFLSRGIYIKEGE